MLEHEYSVLGGVSRTKVGRYLSLISAAVSAGIVFILLWGVDLAKRFGVPANLPPRFYPWSEPVQYLRYFIGCSTAMRGVGPSSATF